MSTGTVNVGEAYRSLRKNAAWAKWYALVRIIPKGIIPGGGKKGRAHPLALNAAYGRVRYWMGDPPPTNTVGWVAFVREAVAAADDRFVKDRVPAPGGYWNQTARRHLLHRAGVGLYNRAVFGAPPTETKVHDDDGR